MSVIVTEQVIPAPAFPLPLDHFQVHFLRKVGMSSREVQSASHTCWNHVLSVSTSKQGKADSSLLISDPTRGCLLGGGFSCLQWWPGHASGTTRDRQAGTDGHVKNTKGGEWQGPPLALTSAHITVSLASTAISAFLLWIKVPGAITPQPVQWRPVYRWGPPWSLS